MTVLITGANGGLGLAIARRFLQDAKHRLWLAVRHGSDQADALAAAHGERCRTLRLDVTSNAAWAEGVDAILKADGRLDVLVNNAGFHHDNLLAMMTEDDWRSVMSANLDGVFLGCRQVVRPMMAQRFGRIVNIASLSALLAPAGQTNYAAAKAGVVALSRSLAKETARSGITVNAVCPGFIETEALTGLSEAERRAMVARIPMRRLGRPEEVAAAVAFLASGEASYITGTVLTIDGGIF